jgi:glycosyltransferase involved in cell wall biosynthesis
LKQTHQFFEILIVNDASTDNSLQLVKELNDKRIRIIENKKNLGLSATRNAGVSHAKNDYIAFLDADDCWHTTFLERIASLIEEFPDEGVFATYYEENFNGKILSPKVKIPENKKGTSFLITNFFELNMGKLIFTQSCLVVKKEVLENINGYNAIVTFAEDIDFFIRCFSKYNLAYHYKACHTQNTTVTSSLTQSSTQDKTYPDLTKQLGISLEIDKFIYFYMYCFCQRLKLEKRLDELRKLRKDIDLKYLTFFQAVLLYLPHPFYKLLIKFKTFLMRKGIELTTYS